MPIFDQGYQHWHGKLAGHAWRWLAITQHGVRTQWTKKPTRRVVIMALGPALALAGFLVIWGLLEQKSELVMPLLSLLRGLPEELRAGPRNFRVPIWTYAFYYFLFIEMLFSMLLVLLVGPDLISQDLRFGAMPLYLSRPLTRLDYFVGKLGVIGVYVAAVTIAPVLLAYVLGICFSLDFHVIGDTYRILLGSLAFGLIVVVSAGSLMLALSSLSRNSRLVGGMWLGVWVIGNTAAGVFQEAVGAKWSPLLSYTNDLARMREVLLDVETAKETLARLFEGLRMVAPPARHEVIVYPWQWSAWVLAGLFGLSICILLSRIRSLDRLR